MSSRNREVGCIARFSAVARDEKPPTLHALNQSRQKIRQVLCPICKRYKFPDEECVERMAQRAAEAPAPSVRSPRRRYGRTGQPA